MDPLAPVPLATGAIVDPTTGGIVRDGRVVDQLTARDVALLGFFAAHPGIDLTRERLGTEVLALAPARLSRAVDSAVFRLRAKIEADPARPVQLITVQNVGYRWIPNAASIGTNIPPARDEILGRDDVLDGVHRTLAAHPSCTIVGPPGIGKTSVALSYARSRSFTGGAVLVELAGHRSKDGAVAAVAKALDVPNTDGEAEAAIGWAIANRGDVLVLLDDCEAVGEALVPTLCAWRSRAPRARWLLTSRARLGDADEHVVAVDPLPHDVGRRLFVARARAIRADFDPSAEPQALDALIDALDGIPLAIELAASRVGALSLAALLDKLSERLRLLRRPGRDRQATLRAVIEQSWELLAEGDREVFASLAVFARAFDADAVRAVLGTAGPEAVERLVARSLVVRTDRGYRLLDSLKAYAEERLAERDRDGVWRRHAAWFTRGAETAWAVILGPDGVSVGRRLVDDGQDLRLVIDRFAHREPTLAALAILATRPGVVRTEQDLSLDATVLTLAGRLGPVLPPPLRFALYRIAGYTLRRQGQYAEARRWFDDAYALREWIGPAALIRITADFGTLSLVSGHPADGVPWCERAVALAEALGERPLLGLVLGDLGVAYAHAGRVDASIQAYERSLAVLEACGAVVMRAVVLGNLGILDAERGQHALARQRFEEAVRMNRLAGNTRTAGVGLSNLGQLADEVGDPASALRYFGEALDVMVRTGSRRLEGVGRANLGGVLARLGRRDEARRELDRSLAIATELGHARDQATAHAELGMLDWATGDLDAAIAHLRTALALGTRGRYEVVYRGFLGAALAVRGADGDRGEAEAEHARAVETAATLRDPSLAPMLAILDAIRARHPRDRAGPPTADLAHDGPALPVGPGPHPWQVQFALDRLRDPAGSR